MKVILLTLLVIALNSTQSFGQIHGWLQTDKKEFEQLFPYFDTIVQNSDHYKKLSKADQIAIPDTLSIGKWEGALNDASAGSEHVTMNITQTYPLIKGTLSFSTMTTDSGPTNIEGEIKGIYKDNHYILVWQIDPDKDILVFLEGNCFKVKDYKFVYTFMGNMIADQEWDFTKGNFFLRKKPEN